MALAAGDIHDLSRHWSRQVQGHGAFARLPGITLLTGSLRGLTGAILEIPGRLARAMPMLTCQSVTNALQPQKVVVDHSFGCRIQLIHDRAMVGRTGIMRVVGALGLAAATTRKPRHAADNDVAACQWP